MARFLHRKVSSHLRKYGHIILALFWFTGLCIGVILYRRAGNSVSSLMRTTATCPVSIVGLLLSSLLPFLFSAFAVYFSFPILLPAICFLKAVCFAFVSCLVVGSFSTSGWLVRWMLMFSDIAGTILFCWYCLRHCTARRDFSPGEAGVFLAAGVIVGILDFCYISPFLQGLY